MGSISPQFEFQEPVIVKLSNEERISGQMMAENVARAVLGFHRDGVVVLENCVDTAHCDTLNKIMTGEIEELIKNPHTHFNDVSSSSIKFFPKRNDDANETLLGQESSRGEAFG